MAWFRKIREQGVAPDRLTPITTRPAREEDAETVVHLAHALSLSDGGRPSQFTTAEYLKNGFGRHAAFSVMVAEAEGAVIGYALYFGGYDTDRAARGIYLADLYVDARWRRCGAGRKLLAAVAADCKEQGGAWMFWSVLKRNKNARRFYRAVAPELRDVVLCAALGDAFDALAGEKS